MFFVKKVGKKRKNAEWAKTHYGSHQEQKKEGCVKYKLHKNPRNNGELAALQSWMDLRTKKTSSELEQYKKSHPQNSSWEQAPLDSSSPAVTLKGGHFYRPYCCFLFSLKGMAVLLRRNEREWENKEKKKKQIQIQFFKDSVNSRYEISYEAAQPRYFVVWYCCCVTRARPRLMHTSSAK